MSDFVKEVWFLKSQFCFQNKGDAWWMMEKINYERRQCRRWSVSRSWLSIILVITESLKLLTVNSVLTEGLGLFRGQGKDVLAEIKHTWTCVVLNFSLPNANKCNRKRQENTKQHVLCRRRKGYCYGWKIKANTQRKFILVINQLDAQNLFYSKFISCLYTLRASCTHRQEVKIVLYSIWYHYTYRWPSGVQIERGRDGHL